MIVDSYYWKQNLYYHIFYCLSYSNTAVICEQRLAKCIIYYFKDFGYAWALKEDSNLFNEGNR